MPMQAPECKALQALLTDYAHSYPQLSRVSNNPRFIFHCLKNKQKKGDDQ